jgi:hypothetical protein
MENHLQQKKNAFMMLMALFYCLSIQAQEYIEFRVYLKDKGSSTELMETPQMFLSSAALNRRALQNIPLDKSDLPIAREYKNSLNAMDAKILAQSKWLNYLYVSHPDPELIQTLPFVERIEFPQHHLSILSRTTEGDTLDYGFAQGQIEMLNGHLLHQSGFTGTGINIAVIDAGYEGFHQNDVFDNLRDSGHLLGSYNFISQDTNVFEGWGDHGTLVLSTMAAHIPNTIVGTAPDANYWLFTTEDILYEDPIEMDLWLMAAEFADSAGVHLISTSLSYLTFDNSQNNYSYSDMDGNTTIITKAADWAASKGILVVASAGNEGSTSQPHIAAPADGDSVLTVGAVTWEGDYASFSSRGPSADGRIKPDVMAQGSPVTIVDGQGQVDIEFGTSYAAPIIAGLAACLMEAYPSSHSEEIADLIRQSAHIYENPNDSLGYGIPNFQLAYHLSAPQYIVQEVGYVVYPNPFQDHLILDTKNQKSWRAVLRIYDLQGRCVYKEKIEAFNAYRVNLHLEPGAYILRLTGDFNGAYQIQKF